MRVLSVKDYSERLRASIQRDGRLNFSDDTGKTLALEDKMSVKFCLDDDDIMYMVLTKGEDADAFKIRKSGSYFYVPLAMLFDALGVDYISNNVSFRLVRVQSMDANLGGTVYRMDKTEKPKQK